MGVVDIDVGSLASSIMKGLDGLFTSDEERMEAQFKIEALLHERLMGQVEINKVEASHRSIFVAGWRPSIGWTCSIGIFYSFVAHPFLTWFQSTMQLAFGWEKVAAFPLLNVEQLMTLAVSMLGVAGYRTFEKVKGVSK